jgi:general secretion pathway protein H
VNLHGTDRLKCSKGFTILELLVVLLIIGILLSLASLSVGGGEARQLREEAQRIVALVDLAAQESLLKSKELALVFEQDGYAFLVEEDEEWVLVEKEGALRPRELPEGMQLTIQVEGQAAEENLLGETESIPVFILSSGEMSQFDLMLSLEDGPSYHLKGDITGSMSLEGPLETL